MEDIGVESETLIRGREIDDGEERESEKRPRVEMRETEEVEEEDGANNKHGGGGGGGGGGILDNLISKLSSSPRAPNPIDVEVFEPASPDDGGAGGGGGGGGGGVINNLISSFFHQKEGEEVVENGEGEKEGVKESEVGEKKVEEQSEGGGIFGGNIITNLVPGEVDTASEEASILIHSVVHD